MLVLGNYQNILPSKLAVSRTLLKPLLVMFTAFIAATPVFANINEKIDVTDLSDLNDKDYAVVLIKRGMANDNELKHAEFEHKKSIEMVNESWGLVFPTIQLEGSYSKVDNWQLSFFSSGNVDPSEYGNVKASAFLRFGTSTLHALNAAGLTLDMSEFNLEVAQNASLIRILKAYFDYIVLARTHAIAEENVDIAQDQLNMTKAMQAQGISRKSDLITAKIGKNQALQQEVSARKDKDIALNRLVVLVGDDFDIREMDLPSAAKLKASFSSHDLFPIIAKYANSGDEQVALQLEAMNSGLNSLKKVAELRKIDASAENSKGLPQVELMGSTGRLRYKGDTQLKNDMVLSASLKWTLFDGFANDARVRQKEATAMQAAINLDNQTQFFRQSLTQYFLDTNASLILAESQEDMLTLTKENYEQIQIEFKKGKVRFADVLKAKKDLDNAKLNAFSAKLAALSSYTNLAAMLGPVDAKSYFSVF